MNTAQLVDMKLIRHHNKKMQEACKKAIDELEAWDTRASADPTTSLGYTVKTLRLALKGDKI